MTVEKMSVSFEPALGAAIRQAAAGAGLGVSAWLTGAALDRLRLESLGKAMAAWEQEFGPLTEAEVGAAERALGAPAAGRRSGAA